VNLKKYHSETDFEINKYVCIMYVNGYNSRLSSYDCFIQKLNTNREMKHVMI
jgi:hypothetical protein